MNKQDIRNLTLGELSKAVTDLGEKPFRAKQITDWLYVKGISSFDEMKNLSKDLRDKLNQHFELKSLTLHEQAVSTDGTTKFLFDLEDGEKVETVLIPTEKRTTACISTQAGCKFGCRFCASGIGGWKRNLTSAEILAQVIHVKQASQQHAKELSHIVFMGIGEPMDNYENLMQAIRIINANDGINIAARRITVSTCGVIPRILEMGKEGIQIELAISLHGFDNESRNVLMPVNKKYPFSDLIDACRQYQKSYRRQITFEYILIKDVTCTPEAAKSLAKSFKGLLCKMNLIPYNPVSEFDHKTPDPGEIRLFAQTLKKAGIHATVRIPRGRDVAAACGQLRHQAQNQ